MFVIQDRRRCRTKCHWIIWLEIRNEILEHLIEFYEVCILIIAHTVHASGTLTDDYTHCHQWIITAKIKKTTQMEVEPEEVEFFLPKQDQEYTEV